MPSAPPAALPFTGDPEADAFLAAEPLALLIGFVLDQQVTVQKAFGGPLELRRRLGTLDAGRIAEMDPAGLEDVFKARPALHRFPGNMARRTQELCRFVVERHGGRAERVWQEATSGRDLLARLLELPGIGPLKAGSLVAILVRRFGVTPAGWQEVMPAHPTLGDVDSPEALLAYQARKREAKRRQRGLDSTS